jgi:hypothetical protein
MINSQGELGGINPAIKRHLELQIKTLQNAPRDADKLERLLKSRLRFLIFSRPMFRVILFGMP